MHVMLAAFCCLEELLTDAHKKLADLSIKNDEALEKLQAELDVLKPIMKLPAERHIVLHCVPVPCCRHLNAGSTFALCSQWPTGSGLEWVLLFTFLPNDLAQIKSIIKSI